MAAGGFRTQRGLLLAARAALTGAAWPWIAAALLGALCAHLLDLAQRWKR